MELYMGKLSEELPIIALIKRRMKKEDALGGATAAPHAPAERPRPAAPCLRLAGPGRPAAAPAGPSAFFNVAQGR